MSLRAVIFASWSAHSSLVSLINAAFAGNAPRGLRHLYSKIKIQFWSFNLCPAVFGRSPFPLVQAALMDLHGSDIQTRHMLHKIF
jgi:hypothetical protein